MSKDQPYKFIIAGGGTGGHIFPAVAIADALKHQMPACEILFVGAQGRMEMEKVPQAGYEIKGLEVVGLQRSFTLKNFLFPYKLSKSLLQASKIVKEFKPSACIGVGGYASGPVLLIAALSGMKIFIQEQNSYPGITNKFLSRYAKKIFVAYDNLNRFFDPSKMILTGNPVRKDITSMLPSRSEALSFFGLKENKKTILVIGGSLGARTINDAMEKNVDMLVANGYQILWQTGKIYYDKIIERAKDKSLDDVKIHQFIKEMNMAYSAANVVVSRAGALSVSELCIVGKPIILVPSPNVAEDHQTKNAMALVNKNAAILVTDSEAPEKLGDAIVELMKDESTYKNLAANIKLMAKTNAANEIAEVIIKEISLN
ncbi:MAG: UDP-N-acetylglucosamine--N-acetylmuramyl-(pentapeptide) pyrophosphoryl-undecaprenol [Bacteroidota bacterium]|nr:UDP-N-acetylglucosamine--N-acetylmuramyl-(pentapeptide) pyrophosphoryl-undecaprenol [Bacteroidota bacterium]